MFQFISALVFFTLGLGFLAISRRRPSFWRQLTAAAHSQLRDFTDALRKIGTGNFGLTLRVLRRFAYVVALVSFVILTVSGFLPVMFGSPASGLALLFHLTVAPVFAISLAALAILWAHRHRFDANDLLQWRRWRERLDSSECEAPRYPNVWQKVTFWLIISSSVPLLLSVVIGMTSWFGTEGQEYLLLLHGYAALVLVAATVIHIGLLMASQQREHEVRREPIAVAAEGQADDK